MEETLEKRIERIKKLAREYYSLEKGVLIEKHTELLKIFDIKGFDTVDKHPHKDKRVCISRKAIKHFVERRKAELEKNHTTEEVLRKVSFALNEIPNIVLHYDLYTREREKSENEKEKHFYTKNYTHQGEPSIRILFDERGDTLEVRSLHFTKNKNTTER